MSEREGAGTVRHAIAGFTRPGFEPVSEAFIENFERRGELGAACCVYLRGEKVVDLWGGIRNEETGEPWEEDTMALVHSTTKGMAGLAMALAHSRGLLDYDEHVSTYWPEFAQQGKGRITVRQLLSHQAGLFALDERPVRSLVADPDQLAVVLARQKPAWPPGERQAYHAITIGFYESELLRRVDPGHRTLGRFFHEEIATPLGIDFYIRLPEEIPDSRLAPLRTASMLGAMVGMPLPLVLPILNPRSRIRRALLGSELPAESDHVYARNLEVPAGGGVGTARAMARAYGVFATGGSELGLREETLRQLMSPAVRPVHGFRDECLKVEIQLSLGFAKPSPRNPFAHPSAFGFPGAGGSSGFADPHAGIGYAYIPNRMGTHLQDPREAALRQAMYRSIGEPDPYRA
ncbi:serine hydrolase domain-containing protein [Anaeromyxobacter oryzisoli]|uniref:serine hydrolase domain-containing protein n=1 Tax=Anaeromyxobacter oryzisoli TaxID=2925408 RepID=UPI001F57A345|nr:serine hydrolase domain-containing protein [Anaeromyxobacter sp. SG63]